MAIFPRPVKVVGQGWSKILVLHLEAGRDGDGFKLFKPTLPCIIKGYNCKFFIS